MSRPRSPLVAALLACALAALGAVGPVSSASAAAPLTAQACEQGRTRYVKDTPAALVRLGARAAWNLATGKGVVVAVVDTGVADANAHFPEGVLLPGRSFVGGSARTDPRAHGTERSEGARQQGRDEGGPGAAHEPPETSVRAAVLPSTGPERSSSVHAWGTGATSPGA